MTYTTKYYIKHPYAIGATPKTLKVTIAEPNDIIHRALTGFNYTP